MLLGWGSPEASVRYGDTNCPDLEETLVAKMYFLSCKILITVSWHMLHANEIESWCVHNLQPHSLGFCLGTRIVYTAVSVILQQEGRSWDGP